MQHMPGEEAWLVGERRASGERKSYLSNLPPDASLKTLAAAIKARWVCEQAHQQLKEELGLDHFEGRSWHGLHRHALMTMIAYAYLQSRRLAEASGGKKNPPRAAQADIARDPARRAGNPRSRPALSMSALQANLPKLSNECAKVVLAIRVKIPVGLPFDPKWKLRSARLQRFHAAWRPFLPISDVARQTLAHADARFDLIPGPLIETNNGGVGLEDLQIDLDTAERRQAPFSF
jgi:hypothetical protein